MNPLSQHLGTGCPHQSFTSRMRMRLPSSSIEGSATQLRTKCTRNQDLWGQERGRRISTITRAQGDDGSYGQEEVPTPVARVSSFSNPSAKSELLIPRRRALIAAYSFMPLLGTAASFAQSGPSLQAPTQGKWEQQVSEFTLPNGLHFIVMERHNVPIVSCHMTANVGAFNEEDGATGLAHLLEHMAFKGSSRLGTTSWHQEAPMLDSLDEVFYELREAKGQDPLSARALKLEEDLRQLQTDADKLAVPNAFGSLLEGEGAIGLNAATSQDKTQYFMSLPVNKLELWFALEADRFQDPVFRSLYSEKRVIEEERRMRIDSAPLGRYQRDFVMNALSNNYRRPIIGYEDDFDSLGRNEVQSFFSKYYGPENLTATVVGDVTADQVYKLAIKYFGGWNPSNVVKLPSGAEGVKAWSSEPLPCPIQGLSSASAELLPRGSESRPSFDGKSVAGPLVQLAFYRPAMATSSGLALEVLCELLSSGRTSRFVKDLVMNGQMLSASAIAAYPGERHAGLALLSGVPKQGYSLEATEKLLMGQIELIKQDGPTEAELARVKKSARAGLLSLLQSNSGLARSLSSYHVEYGSYKEINREMEAIEAVTAEDVLQVARTLLRPDNCFSGYVLKA